MPHFWSDSHTAELQRVRRMKHLFTGLHEVTLHSRDGSNKWKLPIYVTLNWLGDRLTKTYSALVWRRFPQLTAPAKERQAALALLASDLSLPTRMVGIQNCISYAGSASLKLTWPARSRVPVLKRWGAGPGEFTWWESDGGQPYAVTFYRDEVLADYQGRRSVVVRVGERFELLDAGVGVTNTAYQVSVDGVNLDEPVPLAAIYPDDPAQQQEQATLKMSVLPGIQIHNVDETGDAAGDSDYTESLISLQRAQAVLATQRLLTIHLGEMPIMNVPVWAINDDGTIDPAKLMITTREYGEDPKNCVPINLNNWTGNMENSSKQWELNNQEFYQLTGLAPAIDGQAQAGGESGYARRLGLVKTEAAIEARRAAWGPFWAWLGTAVPELAATREAGRYGGPIDGITASWPAAIPEDPDGLSTRTIAEVRGGLRSEKLGIRLLNETFTPEQVEQEQADIAEDRRERAALALPNFQIPTV
ncbi:MAG: hypothetical protein ACYDCO_26555 [Armatimonadota bacterium]